MKSKTIIKKRDLANTSLVVLVLGLTTIYSKAISNFLQKRDNRQLAYVENNTSLRTNRMSR